MKNSLSQLTDGIVEVRGAAGAGKTFQLTNDIIKLCSQNKKVAVISFSNVAVNELKSRLGNIDVTLSTIHSFCWKVIKPISKRILEFAKIRPGFIPQGISDTPGVTLSDVHQIKYGEIGIPQFKKNGDLWLSHDDVINMFIFSISHIKSFSSIIAGSFDYILIDEYQDTNGKFLNCLFNHLSSKIVIGLYGDPYQAIYLNADSINMADVSKKYTVTKFELEYNYRSQKNLVSFFNKVRFPFDNVQQQAKLKQENEVFVFYGDNQLEPNTINKIQQFIHFEKPIVLSLTNGLRTSIAGFNTITKKLKKCVPSTRSLTWPEVLNSDKLNGYIKALLQYSNIFYGSNYESAQGLLQVFDIASLLNVSLTEIHNIVCKQIQSNKANLENFTSLGLALSSEFAPLNNWLNGFSLVELKQIKYFYQSLQEINKKSITIYAAKGLEFQNVILNIDWGRFPNKNWDNINFNYSEDSALNLRTDVMSYLFYVGITRAKKGLAIYINTKEHATFFNNFKSKFPELQYFNISQL